MLRTIVLRGELVKGQVQKVIRTTEIRRSLSLPASQEVSRKHYNVRQQCLVPRTTDLCSDLSLRINPSPRARLYSSYDGVPHTKVALPALSPTMEEGTLVSWEKKEGDKLSEGDLLAEIETDKATMAMETPEEGYLAKILIPAGTKGVPIGRLVCIIVEREEDVAKFQAYKDDDASTGPASTLAPAAPAAAVPAFPPPAAVVPPIAATVASRPAEVSERVYASPMAKRLAEQRNIRLHGKGTGLFDSITSKDLDSLTSSAGIAGEVGAAPMAHVPPSRVVTSTPFAGQQYIDIPVSNMRAVIAKRLLQSKQQVPHYYLTADVCVDRILHLRQRLNKRLEKEKSPDGKVSVNDFILKAVAIACTRVPEANSAWHETIIRQYSSVDISVAVSTDKGLLTPIVFAAQSLGVQAIGAQVKQLAAKARSGKLQPHEFQGGTISVSNLGMYGVDQFAAIINPPQACILAVGAVVKRMELDDALDRGFCERSVLSVTLSADHRVVDGAVGARWLQAFRQCIEDPESMIF